MANQTDWAPTRLKPESDEYATRPMEAPESSTIAIKRTFRLSGPIFLVLSIFAALLFIVIGYQTGTFQTLGYESKTKQGGGFTSSASGYTLGTKTMYFFKGQEVFADYDVDVTSGSLVIRMHNYSGVMNPDAHFRHRVAGDSRGRVNFVVEEDGFYRLFFEGSVLGNSPAGSGYDINYTVTWGMREFE